MRRHPLRLWLLTTILTITTFYSSLALSATEEQKPLENSDQKYKYGDPIPVSCLNRTIDTGEHVADAQGRLQYVPFPTCNETGRPLELYFGMEKGITVTIFKISLCGCPSQTQSTSITLFHVSNEA